MKDETRKNLVDILNAAVEIREFIEGMDFHDYQESTVTRRAVERNFEIIGEALNRVKSKEDELIEEISEHYRIIGFRNILIHGYDIVDEAIVWQAATKHLPVLVAEVEDLLKR